METQYYTVASQKWEGPLFSVVDQSGQELLDIPLEFARKGLCNTIAFALSQVNFCYEELGHLRSADGRDLLDPSEPLLAGIATFVRSDQSESSCTPRKGPRFKYGHRAPTDDSDSSTMSNSRRSSYNQSSFLMAVVARDASCLLTDEQYRECTACHILPQSRPEVGESLHATFGHFSHIARRLPPFFPSFVQYYREILGRKAGSLFQAEYGLLLRDDLHHRFDRGEWALHEDGENLIVHVFDASVSSLFEHHGKIIGPNRFHTKPHEHPNRALLRFHYQQTCMMRLRGFSAGY
jgi:HNH endonuclease